MGVKLRRFHEGFRQQMGLAKETTSNARIKAAVQEATDFSHQLKKCRAAILELKKSSDASPRRPCPLSF
jgi:hypothetical protein